MLAEEKWYRNQRRHGSFTGRGYNGCGVFREKALWVGHVRAPRGSKGDDQPWSVAPLPRPIAAWNSCLTWTDALEAADIWTTFGLTVRQSDLSYKNSFTDRAWQRNIVPCHGCGVIDFSETMQIPGERFRLTLQRRRGWVPQKDKRCLRGKCFREENMYAGKIDVTRKHVCALESAW